MTLKVGLVPIEATIKKKTILNLDCDCILIFNIFSCTDGTKQSSHGVHKILSVFAKKSDSPTSPKLGGEATKNKDSTESTTTMAVMQDSLKEGWLEVLVSSTDGKASSSFFN